MDNLWQNVSVSRFTDGVTDKITAPSKGNQCEILENLIPQEDGSLKQRDGFAPWIDKDTATDILQIWEFQGFIIFYSSDKMFYYIDETNPITRGKVLPTDGTTDYQATEYDGYWHATEVNGELILTHKPSTETSQRTSIKRIFVNSSGIPKFETAQLPRLIKSSGSVISATGSGITHFVEVYWKRTYDCMVNGEILEKTIYGQSEVATVEATALTDITIAWDAFDNHNVLIATGIYDSDFCEEEYWDENIELVVAVSDDLESVPYIRDYGSISIGDGSFTLTGTLPAKGAQTYTELGESLNSTIPLGAYFNTVCNDMVYYGNANGESDRIYQAKEDAPYHTSLLSYVEVPSKLVGLDNFNGKPIAFTKESSHRIEGSKSANGTGSIYQRVISDRYGCIAPSSVIKTESGLVFFSQGGICFTDGIKALIISDNLNRRYKNWIDTDNKKASIIGFYDVDENKVYWRIEEDSIPMLLVLDLRWGISQECSFYMIRGNHSLWDLKDGIKSDSIYFTDGLTIYNFDSVNTFDTYTDGIDTYESPIIYKYKSYAINYGDNLNRKWTSKIFVNLKDNEDQLGVSFDIRAYNDLSQRAHLLESCHFYQRMVWDDSEDGIVNETQYWGAVDPVWNANKMINFQRRFPNDYIRNTFKAIEFKNAMITSFTSDTIEKGRFSLNSTDRRLILPSYDVATTFLTQALIDEERYYLFTEEDDYTNGYLITGIEDDIDGNLNIIAQGDSDTTEGELVIKFCEWKIKAYSKNQVFHLLSYVLMYMNMGHFTNPTYISNSGVSV